MEGLAEDEISTICKQFSVHHLTYEDISTHDSPEKSEEYANYLFVSTTETTYSAHNELIQSNIYLVIFKSFILVFHPKPLDCMEIVLRSFRYLDQGRLQASDWVLCTFLDSINEIYSSLSDQLMNEVNVLDDYTLREELAKSELYVRLGRAIRKATNLLSWLFIKTNNISDETDRFLNNIKDRSLRLQQKIKLCEELLENINTIYISKVSLVLNEESHSLNVSMTRFASLTLIFMPLNWVAGIYGMNVRLPGTTSFLPESQGLEYFTVITVFMAVFIIGLGGYLRKLGWL
eukprot:gene4014-4649_t